MPVYEYECKACGARFEKIQPVTADPVQECEVCGQSPVRRVFHPVGIIFKGSGWYITDSRKSSGAGSSGKSASGESAGTGSSSSESGSTETKAEAPKEKAAGEKTASE